MSITLDKLPPPEPPENASLEAGDIDQAAEPDTQQSAGPDTEDDRAPAALGERVQENAQALRVGLADYGRRGVAGTRLWLGAADVSDEQLVEEVRLAAQRKREQHAAGLRARAGELHNQIATQRGADAERGLHGDSSTVVNLRRELARIEAELAEHAAPTVTEALPPDARLVRRARGRKKLERALVLLGSVTGGIMLPLHDLRLLLVSLPVAAIALYKMGARADEADDQAQGFGYPPVPAQAAGAVPQQVAPADPAREAERLAGIGQAAEVSQAPLSPMEARAADTVIDALVKAKVITAADREDTHLAGAPRGDGPGWTATVDLPRGQSAEEAIARARNIASALRVDEQQLQLHVVKGQQGSHSGRLRMWVADDPNPFEGETPSPLETAGRWDLWNDGVPLGRDARGIRQILHLLWQSWMLGGNPGQGKSYLARLAAAAGALDPTVRVHVITGKVSPDWDACEQFAYSYITGNTERHILAAYLLLGELLDRVREKGAELARLAKEEPQACPKGKLTKELSLRKGLELDLLIVDELQELLDAAAEFDIDLDEESGQVVIKRHTGRGEGNARGELITRFARHIRTARSVASLTVLITQRPDADSIPTKLRGVASIRSCNQVSDRDAAEMVLTGPMVKAGAAPHLFPFSGWEGVTVINMSEHGGHTTLKADMLDLPEFNAICRRGRDLRIAEGRLTGHAAQAYEQARRQAEAEAEAERERLGAQLILRDVIEVMDKAGLEMARTETLAKLLADAYGLRYEGITGPQVAERLRRAGAGGTVRLGALDGLANASGYKLDTLRAALAA
jgi:S-DNA-T family DNA segregation ATPase FtsK/SpoIIIE